jgi:hypothetical protein
LESIKIAERMLSLLDEEAKLAKDWVEKMTYREQQAILERVAARDIRKFQMEGEVTRIWRQEGRQTLAMHPELVAEIALATSDKIYPEVLRALPYINPLVVYPGGSAELDSWKPNERMRLMGFLTYGVRKSEVYEQGIDVKVPVRWIRSTNDADADHLGMTLIFECVESGQVVDYEVSNMTLPTFGSPQTIKEMADEISDRYQWKDALAIDEQTSREWFVRVMKIVLGSLCYLASTVLDVERVPTKAVAKRQSKAISRKPLSLYNVGWTIGAGLSKARAQRKQYGGNSQQGDITHQQDPQHRKAHFKMQPYGPGRAFRRVCYISAYWTHRERLGVQGVNTSRKVV